MNWLMLLIVLKVHTQVRLLSGMLNCLESKTFFDWLATGEGIVSLEKESSCPLDAELCVREALRPQRPYQSSMVSHQQVQACQDRST